MDPITLSRLQFALTTIYHWLFVPLTLGLGWFVAFMQTRYYQTKDETWHKMTKFWGKLFLINFAIGVVTGIVQEFQFGMNWSEYSRYVGDIFGAPLAIEALLAFFMESTFLGIWVFGEGRVPEKVDLAGRHRLQSFRTMDPACQWLDAASGWLHHQRRQGASGTGQLLCTHWQPQRLVVLLAYHFGWPADGSLYDFGSQRLSSFPQTECRFLQTFLCDRFRRCADRQCVGLPWWAHNGSVHV